MTARQPFRLTPVQYERLTMALDGNRVGKNPKGFSHMEAWDIRRWLIRVFGFGSFDIETIALDLVKEIEHPIRRRKDKKGQEYGDPYIPWTVVYRAQVRLTIWDQFGGHVVLEDGACGDSSNQPSVGDCHDNASKTALSQALKRCAVNLGDCFGLSLYDGGSTKPTVVRSLVAPEMPAGDGPTVALPTDDAPVRPEPGTEPAAVAEEPAPEQAAAGEAAPAAPAAAMPKPAPTAKGIRDWALEPGRTAGAIRKAAAKLRQEHPEVAAERITNEHGDDEQLSVLLERKARELAPAAEQPAAPAEQIERRRKRMFALFNDLGYGGESQRAARHRIASRVLNHEVTSMTEVTALADVEAIITALEDRQRQAAPAAAA